MNNKLSNPTRPPQTVGTGELIILTGDTGNAHSRNISVVPHVHIKARINDNGTWKKANQEDFMGTKFNSDGTVDSTNSSCD